MRCRAAAFSAALIRPSSSSGRIASGSSSRVNVAPCCSANNSVGAMIAA